MITNPANAGNINVDVGTPVSGNAVNGAFGGIFTATFGAGSINIVTQHGATVSSTNGDGIDAFALGGGNVFIHLLDGAINSNTSGCGPSAVQNGGNHVPTNGGKSGVIGATGVPVPEHAHLRLLGADRSGRHARDRGGQRHDHHHHR